MRNAIVTAAATLVLFTTTASAQPAMTAPIEPTATEVPEIKSGSTATLLAVGATLGGVALMATGAQHEEGSVVLGGAVLMLIGPSAGHFYANETGHGAKMTLLRTGAAVVLGFGLLEQTMAANCDVASSGGGGCSTKDSRDNGEKLMWLGGATLVAATVYDLWDAHNAADRANAKAARTWSVAPSMMAGASGTMAPALTVAGSF